jgi:hypothetical protein
MIKSYYSSFYCSVAVEKCQVMAVVAMKVGEIA